MSTEPETPAPFKPYEVPHIGTVEDHAGNTYVVHVASGSVYGYISPSGTPSQELAAEEIAYVIANPPPVPEAVPAELPAWRIRAVASLHELTPAIATALAALAEPARTVATEVWQNGNTIRRDSALVAQLAAALGLTACQLDAYFIEAAALPT